MRESLTWAIKPWAPTITSTQGVVPCRACARHACLRRARRRTSRVSRFFDQLEQSAAEPHNDLLSRLELFDPRPPLTRSRAARSRAPELLATSPAAWPFAQQSATAKDRWIRLPSRRPHCDRARDPHWFGPTRPADRYPTRPRVYHDLGEHRTGPKRASRWPILWLSAAPP